MTLWVHALSVGEVLAAQPLVERICERHPELRIVLTVSTLSGFEIALQRFKEQPVDLAFFPYDWIWSVRVVADKIDAQAVILMETDIWPNFLAEMKRRNVPVYMVNMRISDSAWKSYRRLKWGAAKVFGAFAKICVQTQKDARRLSRLGVAPERLNVTGNIKFDSVAMSVNNGIEAKWRQKLPLAHAPKVIVAGSTHDGEETIVLDAFAALKKENRAVGLIIAPRDANRSQHVLDMCATKGLTAKRLSQLPSEKVSPSIEIIVVDYIGVLKELYSIANVAFVGGSLVNEGGHNPLEPAIFGKPIVFGPDMRDFRQIATWLLQAGGARRVSHQGELVKVLSQILDSDRLATALGDQAQQVVLLHQGATHKTIDTLNLAALRQ